MDYKEEQRNEMEALESIYCDELEILSTDPYYKFAVQLKTEDFEFETKNGLSCLLEFSYTAKYPEEPLLIAIQDTENFEEGCEDELKEHLTKEMSENLGMVMVFTLVSTAQEWLNVQWDKIKLSRKESEAQKLRDEEEAERRRFEGTRVTVETFLSWKGKFDEEMGYTKKREMADREGKKLTGRELFMMDKSLDQSDLKFLDDGDAVKVDESLFQNLDDLELVDDEEEDDDDDDDAADSC